MQLRVWPNDDVLDVVSDADTDANLDEVLDVDYADELADSFKWKFKNSYNNIIIHSTKFKYFTSYSDCSLSSAIINILIYAQLTTLTTKTTLCVWKCLSENLPYLKLLFCISHT